MKPPNEQLILINLQLIAYKIHLFINVVKSGQMIKLIVCFIQDLKKSRLVVFANKQDVKGCMSAAEISQHLSLTSVKDRAWHIQACCALTGEG